MARLTSVLRKFGGVIVVKRSNGLERLMRSMNVRRADVVKVKKYSSDTANE